MAPPDQAYREQLISLLEGHGAHMPFEEAIADFPEDAINVFPTNVSYTPWHLIEHIRITQWDILRYIVDPAHVSPNWPTDYWPDRDATATPEQFQASIDAFLADREALEDICLDRSTDLGAPMSHAPRHSIGREVRVVANHNSYHVGELGALRQVTRSWGPGHE